MTPQTEARLLELLQRCEPLLPPSSAIDWSAPAYRWQVRRYLGSEVGTLAPIHRTAPIRPDDLHRIETQKAAILRNTEQFVSGLPANNVLLTGARGTGKSSLIRACLACFAARGLRMIEVDKADLVHLPQIGALVAGRSERFIVFCDDLSFEEGEAAYKALKAALDGSLAAVDDRLLVYATSNRRHLMPESMRENHDATMADDGEIHPGERVEEKISLSERFGLWLSFYPFSQDGYLDIVAHWLGHHGLDAAAIDAARLEALQFAQARGSRSGRVALQFARDWAGRLGLERGLAAGNGKGHGQGLDRPAPREVVDVAVGILTRADGAVLLADRPAGKPYAGYWEFPGGKVEPGETIAQALARELREELGIEVGASVPWMVYEHDYPHAYVRLHFSRIHDWRGTPRANEGQRLMYLRDGEAAPQPLLPAAGPALERCFDSDPPAAG